MTFYVENETEETFAEGEVSFSVEDTVEKVANAVLEMEGCPYEVQLNVLLTDNDGIHAYNKEYRNTERRMSFLSPIWTLLPPVILIFRRTERLIILIRIPEN